MRWPADHPAVTDPALAAWSGGADEVCPDATVVRVLRHLPGRRVATLVETPTGPAVLKVFARPRARGNERRLRLLAACPTTGAMVPQPLGADSAGHVGLVGYVPGQVFDTLDDETFVHTAGLVGAALVRLHSAWITLDRSWTWSQEVDLLQRRMTATSEPWIADAVATTRHLAAEPSVVSHRDCHPRQVVLTGDGTVRWIDLDDAAQAPATLDVGNMLAHLARDGATGQRSVPVSAAASAAFRDAYGSVPGDLSAWHHLALLRLAGLAESRHGRPDQARRILSLLEPGRAVSVA